MNVLTKQVMLEPEAQAFADATPKPSFVFDLGPEKSRVAVNANADVLRDEGEVVANKLRKVGAGQSDPGR